MLASLQHLIGQDCLHMTARQEHFLVAEHVLATSIFACVIVASAFYEACMAMGTCSTLR